MNDKKNIAELWASLKANGDRYRPVWDSIAKFTGITVQPDYLWGKEQTTGDTLDQFVDDPTTAISVNQFGDYLIGIMWGTGEKALNIVPSRYVLEYESKEALQGFYDFATDQTLYHMNHSGAGLITALKPYAYDQASFGTSGVGLFKNKAFETRTEDNAFIARNYGIDSTRIDEGKSGLPEIVFSMHRWRVNRIIGEFAMNGGKMDAKAFNKLPKQIKDAYNAKDFNKEFSLVNGVFPREDFDPKFKGARGTRYRGVWFLDDECEVFFEESFAERPISMCRQILVRGQVYGRSSGTMLMSTIRSVNFMVGTVIEIIEKMSNPSLGMLNNAIFGDSVLDTSPNGLTIFNQALAGNNPPLFPLHDVGDPSGIVEFLIPYLNEKIVTAFKIDALLDFSSAKEMTATESLQRYAIRGKSLSGLLTQQKIELLEPLVRRAVSILLDLGELGVDPKLQAERAAKLMELGKSERIIPESVQRVIDEGRPWYEIRFNNELEKLTRTESVQALVQVLQAITGIAALYPTIIEAVDWYKLLKDFNDNLDANSQIMFTETEFKAKVEAAAKAQQAAMALQAGQMGADIQKNTAQANKSNKEAQNVGK